MKTWVQLLAVGGAGFAGAVARWAVGLWFGRWMLAFPLGTLVINVTGSFLLGWFATFVDRRGAHEMLKLAIGTGFVGAYTTFSTYMWESNRLMERGALYEAWANIIGSIVLGLLAVYLGVRLGKL
jgi:CrcB protein